MSTVPPAAWVSSHSGARTPAAKPSGAPPAKRALTSVNAGEPSARAQALHGDRPARPQRSGDRHAVAQDLGVVHRDSLGHLAAADLEPSPRNDRDGDAVPQAEHVAGDLRPGQVLLHHRVGDAREPELELGAVGDDVGVCTGAAEARLDEHRERQTGVRLRLLGRPVRGRGHPEAGEQLGRRALVGDGHGRLARGAPSPAPRWRPARHGGPRARGRRGRSAGRSARLARSHTARPASRRSAARRCAGP